jgi:hypothetical protein
MLIATEGFLTEPELPIITAFVLCQVETWRPRPLTHALTHAKEEHRLGRNPGNRKGRALQVLTATHFLHGDQTASGSHSFSPRYFIFRGGARDGWRFGSRCPHAPLPTPRKNAAAPFFVAAHPNLSPIPSALRRQRLAATLQGAPSLPRRSS